MCYGNLKNPQVYCVCLSFPLVMQGLCPRVGTLCLPAIPSPDPKPVPLHSYSGTRVSSSTSKMTFALPISLPVLFTAPFFPTKGGRVREEKLFNKENSWQWLLMLINSCNICHPLLNHSFWKKKARLHCHMIGSCKKRKSYLVKNSTGISFITIRGRHFRKSSTVSQTSLISSALLHSPF